MPRHLIYAVVAVIAVLAGGGYFLYGPSGFSVHDGRGGRQSMPQPPAVLDKLQLTQHQNAHPPRGPRGPFGMGRPSREERRAERREQNRNQPNPQNRVQASWTDAGGNAVRTGDFRGRLLVLNLWATWCGPCITELPALARTKQALANDGVAVVAVDLEKKESADIAAFLKQHGADGLDVNIDRDLNLMRTYAAYGLPLTIVFDRQGREIARAAGPQKWDDPDALAYLRQLAKWQPGPPERREERDRTPHPRGLGRVIRHLGH